MVIGKILESPWDAVSVKGAEPGSRIIRNILFFFSSVFLAVHLLCSVLFVDSLTASQATTRWPQFLSEPVMFLSNDIALHLEVRF